jgi:hypoxanthine phosphoribosyltransferase
MNELIKNHPNSFVLVSKEEIGARITEMQREIESDFPSWGVNELVVMQVLLGAVPFCNDLRRRLALDYKLDSIRLSSYGHGKESSGKIEILQRPQLDLTGKGVLIVEDIVDTGLSMTECKRFIESLGAKVVKVATFLDKPASRKLEFTADFVGKAIPPEFVVGYGLDFDQKYRELEDVWVLKD